MLKKIVIGTVLVGLMGVLVLGAIHRSVDRTGKTTEREGQGSGRGQALSEVSGGNKYQDRADAPGGQAGREQASGGVSGRKGYQDRADAPGDQTGAGQAQVDEWLQLKGIVTGAGADVLSVQTGDGEQINVENRAWWFAQEQGFGVQVGDQVTLTGFYEEGDFEVGRIDNATNGQTVWIRDENGRPLWAGGGRRGA